VGENRSGFRALMVVSVVVVVAVMTVGLCIMSFRTLDMPRGG